MFKEERLEKILEIIVFPHIKANDQVEFIDYKSRLQEFVQSETRNNLEYVEIKKEGPTNNPKFTMNVVLEGIILGTGVGGNKKSAQQAAAKDALAKVAKAKNN